MAKQTIDIGSSPNKGDGDPLRTAFTKINQNFDELYAGGFADPESVGSNLSPDTDATYNLGSADKQWADAHISDFLYLNGQRIEALSSGALLVNGSGAREAADIVGSVFGNDSTLLVDGTNNLIPSNVVSGIEADRWTEAYSWGDHSTAGYQSDSGPFIGDLTGSVFADDSTLLVDAVNGNIPSSVIDGQLSRENIPNEYLRFPDPEVLVTVPTPTANGTKGEVRYASGYVYICIAANTWVRSQVETAWG